MGDKSKIMRPKATRVGDTCVETSGRQVQTHAAQDTQRVETSVGDKWKTSANSCGPRHPECETSVGDKCKLMRPKTPRVWKTSVGDKCRRQV